jgi:hypothetical protein
MTTMECQGWRTRTLLQASEPPGRGYHRHVHRVTNRKMSVLLRERERERETLPWESDASHEAHLN